MRLLIFSILLICSFQEPIKRRHSSEIVVFKTDASRIKFHYQHNGKRFGSIRQLVAYDSSIKFAMNGAMFAAGDFAPVGLYVERNRVIHKLNLFENNSVNFGINPQAVFYIDRNGKAGLIDAKKSNPANYYYAVQIGPLFLNNGIINPKFSTGFNGKARLRNGIGITLNGKIVFILAKGLTTFTQLAQLFKDNGCITASYIDGGVSEMWKSGKEFGGGEFGVLVSSR